jgi:hypothetical protein
VDGLGRPADGKGPLGNVRFVSPFRQEVPFARVYLLFRMEPRGLFESTRCAVSCCAVMLCFDCCDLIADMLCSSLGAVHPLARSDPPDAGHGMCAT